MSCHKKLQETNDGKCTCAISCENKSLTAAANFLKALQENQTMCVPVAITCCFTKEFDHSTLQTTTWTTILLGNVYPLI